MASILLTEVLEGALSALSEPREAVGQDQQDDAADAEGCCEAVQRPSMRFVPVKSETQQGLLMLHRIRDRPVAERTGTISAVRGHMAEFGLVAARRGPV